jgi:hypothetical protein
MKYILSLVILSSFCLDGCVGAWVLQEKSHVTSYVEIQQSNHQSNDKTKDKPLCNLPDKLQTKQSILKKYGNPVDIEKSDNKEIWHYDKELGWSGVVPVLVVVPLPFIFPSNRETVFEFDGDKLLLEKEFYTEEKIHGCGIFAAHTIEFGCYSM